MFEDGGCDYVCDECYAYRLRGTDNWIVADLKVMWGEMECCMCKRKITAEVRE
jgi:hypothetical protein